MYCYNCGAKAKANELECQYCGKINYFSKIQLKLMRKLNDILVEASLK